MSSVDDIRLKENYIVLDSWDACHRPVLKVYPERRECLLFSVWVPSCFRLKKSGPDG